MAQGVIDRTGAEDMLLTGSQGFDEEESIDLVQLFQALLRRKWTILALSLGCFVLATVFAFLLPLQYTSTASFIPPNVSAGGSMASALAGQLSAIGAGDMLGTAKSSGELYSGMLKSRSVLGDLVKHFDLMQLYGLKKESQAEETLAGKTVISVDVKSTIVTLSVTDKSPERARDLANAYMDALRETESRLALGQSSQRRLFFGQQLAKEKDDLEDAEVELKKTEERSGLIAPAGQTESEIKTIAETQAQLAARQVQLAALRESGTEQNPEIIRLRSEIDDLQGQLKRLQNGGAMGTVAAIPTSRVPQLELDYVRKKREVEYHEALFDALAKQYEAARLDEAHDAPVLQVLDPASYPDSKSGPKRSYYMLGGLMLGFLGSCAWILIQERVHSLRSQLAASEAAAPVTEEAHKASDQN
jgi:tyrosine-protein kinase Etk/Wzc